MTTVVILLALFLAIGLVARRLNGWTRALLLCGIVLLVTYATLSGP